MIGSAPSMTVIGKARVRARRTKGGAEKIGLLH
jgi:hypothetical protein